MKESMFMMFGDISHSELADLTKRTKTVRVVASYHMGGDEDGQDELSMDMCIEYYRCLYAKDMLRRCGLTDDNGERLEKLPSIMAMAALLNPMYGGKSCFSFLSCNVLNCKSLTILLVSLSSCTHRTTHDGGNRFNGKASIQNSRALSYRSNAAYPRA